MYETTCPELVYTEHVLREQKPRSEGLKRFKQVRCNTLGEK